MLLPFEAQNYINIVCPLLSLPWFPNSVMANVLVCHSVDCETVDERYQACLFETLAQSWGAHLSLYRSATGLVMNAVL